jgi:hypothetical protein
MNTTENNKLISEFLGFKKSPEFAKGLYINFKQRTQIYENQMLYHSDWNWLMEVVEKIKNLGFRYNCFFTDKKSYVSFADWTETKEHSFVCLGTNGEEYGTENNPIEAVYNVCIEFIKWHNQQQ